MNKWPKGCEQTQSCHTTTSLPVSRAEAAPRSRQGVAKQRRLGPELQSHQQKELLISSLQRAALPVSSLTLSNWEPMMCSGWHFESEGGGADNVPREQWAFVHASLSFFSRVQGEEDSVSLHSQRSDHLGICKARASPALSPQPAQRPKCPLRSSPLPHRISQVNSKLKLFFFWLFYLKTLGCGPPLPHPFPTLTPGHDNATRTHTYKAVSCTQKHRSCAHDNIEKIHYI